MIENQIIRECPVCWQLVEVHNTFFTHRDRTGKQRCPMSGQPAPTRWRRAGQARHPLPEAVAS